MKGEGTRGRRSPCLSTHASTSRAAWGSDAESGLWGRGSLWMSRAEWEPCRAQNPHRGGIQMLLQYFQLQPEAMPNPSSRKSSRATQQSHQDKVVHPLPCHGPHGAFHQCLRCCVADSTLPLPCFFPFFPHPTSFFLGRQLHCTCLMLLLCIVQHFLLHPAL